VGSALDGAWRGGAAEARHARPNAAAGALYASAAAAGLRRELLACRAGAFDTYVEAADIGANIELGGRVSRLRQETGRGRTGSRELRFRSSAIFSPPVECSTRRGESSGRQPTLDDGTEALGFRLYPAECVGRWLVPVKDAVFALLTPTDIEHLALRGGQSVGDLIVERLRARRRLIEALAEGITAVAAS
jgi:hypothetical protein